MAREVRLLTPGDIASAASAIASGHGDYPAFRAVWPDLDRRRRALTAFFAATVRDGLSFGATHGVVTDGRVDAVAVWLPPGAFPWSARRKARATPSFLRVAAADPQAFSRFARYGATAERHHPEGDHWYLVVLSVRRGVQRAGIGTRVLLPVLDRADADGTAYYLETSDPANVAFYERLGFAVRDEAVQLVPDGPPHVTMWRDPKVA